MFEPYRTIERFDRNIFNGNGTHVTLTVKKRTPLLYYFKTDVVVGMITKTVKALAYEHYKRGEFIPVEVMVGEKSYCGWVNKKDVVIN